MNKKVIKINETQLRNLVSESIKNVLKEFNERDFWNSEEGIRFKTELRKEKQAERRAINKERRKNGELSPLTQDEQIKSFMHSMSSRMSNMLYYGFYGYNRESGKKFLNVIYEMYNEIGLNGNSLSFEDFLEAFINSRVKVLGVSFETCMWLKDSFDAYQAANIMDIPWIDITIRTFDSHNTNNLNINSVKKIPFIEELTYLKEKYPKSLTNVLQIKSPNQ